MKPNKKYPDQIFVTARKVEEMECERDVLGKWTSKVVKTSKFGFLHPHEPGKSADEKRKETQLGWAYSGSALFVNGEWIEKGTDYTWEMSPMTGRQERKAYPYIRPIDPDYAPRVWDNVPLTGFKIVDTVNRYRGNKLFKVADPRGFDFEITAKSLFHILMDGEVKNGEIISQCIWAAGKNLVVIV